MDMFHRERREGPLLTKKEVKELLNIARKEFLSDHPNPERLGCPDPKLLRDLAFQKIESAEKVKEVTDHVVQCSPCYRELRDYAERYKQSRRRVQLAAAAIVFLSLSFALIFAIKHFHKNNSNTAKGVTPKVVPPSPTREQENAKMAAPPTVKYEEALLDLRDLVRRDESQPVKSGALSLKRRFVHLRIYLPVGSDEGKYEIQLTQKGKLFWKRMATARITKKGISLIEIEEDLTGIPAGSALLTICPPGCTYRQQYPINIS
jgi:hypothetical protein